MKPSRQQYSLLSASAYGILLFKAEGKCGDPKTALHEIKQLLKNDFIIDHLVTCSLLCK